MRKSLGISLAFLMVVIFSAEAFAERGRGRGRRRQQAPTPTTPHSDQIVSAMDDIEWGWNHKRLVTHFTRQLRKMYRPVLAKANDAVAEDRLRRQQDARIRRISKSFVEFNGQRTGWDTSLIRDQYTHNNGESVVEVRELRAGGHDPRYTDYFFFINGHLWRRYRAFNQDQFAGIPFEAAAASFQKRFGPAKELRRGEKLMALEWQDSTTKLQAVDNTEFFGVFCLVFTEKATEGRLSSLRKNKATQKRSLNPLVEGLRDGATRDVHTNVVEHITGKRYKTAQSQEDATSSSGRGGGRKTSPASTSKRRSGGDLLEDRPAKQRKSSGDPLLDLEI